MADEKKLMARSKIERALGKIEGLSTGLDDDIAAVLVDAVEDIDLALHEIFADGRKEDSA